MPDKNIEISDIMADVFNYLTTLWKDEINDPEGDNSQEATPFSAARANKFEKAIELAHKRLNDFASYTKDSERMQKDLRFQFLLLKASVTSGLTSNILVDNFEDLEGINLTAGAHNAALQRIYLP